MAAAADHGLAGGTSLVRFAARRAVHAALFVLLASSGAWLLASLAPGDHLSGFDVAPAFAEAERRRLGLDQPIAAQYASWLWRAAHLDLGTSIKYQRPVATLIADRAPNTALLAVSALALATGLGVVAGTHTGASSAGVLAVVARGVSLALLSLPPLVTSFTLLVLAAATGWLPVGGFPLSSGWTFTAVADRARYLILPTLALGLPLAASLERLQAGAIRDALAQPSMQAARARGLPAGRILWRHALRLSLTSVLSLYGLIVASTLSGSFVVEVVMSWPGLGALMYEALVGRDLFLVAGCAAAVASFLAFGGLASDLALAAADPRLDRGR